MSDRYDGITKCPYCGKDTYFFYAYEWAKTDRCSHCSKEFQVEIRTEWW